MDIPQGPEDIVLGEDVTHLFAPDHVLQKTCNINLTNSATTSTARVYVSGVHLVGKP